MLPVPRKVSGARSRRCSAPRRSASCATSIVVKREDFEAVKEMARLAREENEALKVRIAALEAAIGASKADRRAAR